MRKKAELFLSYTALVLALFLPPAGLILGLIAYKFRIDKEHKVTIAAIVLGAILSLTIVITIIFAISEYNSLEKGECEFTEGFECLDVVPFDNVLEVDIKYLGMLELDIKNVALTDINYNKITDCRFSQSLLRQNQELNIICETPKSNSYFFEIEYSLDPRQTFKARGYFIE